MFKPGDSVGIKKTLLKGVVTEFKVSTDGKTLSYLVSYTEDDETKERVCNDAELVLVEEEKTLAAAPAPAAPKK